MNILAFLRRIFRNSRGDVPKTHEFSASSEESNLPAETEERIPQLEENTAFTSEEEAFRTSQPKINTDPRSFGYQPNPFRDTEKSEK